MRSAVDRRLGGGDDICAAGCGYFLEQASNPRINPILKNPLVGIIFTVKNPLPGAQCPVSLNNAFGKSAAKGGPHELQQPFGIWLIYSEAAQRMEN